MSGPRHGRELPVITGKRTKMVGHAVVANPCDLQIIAAAIDKGQCRGGRDQVDRRQWAAKMA